MALAVASRVGRPVRWSGELASVCRNAADSAGRAAAAASASAGRWRPAQRQRRQPEREPFRRLPLPWAAASSSSSSSLCVCAAPPPFCVLCDSIRPAGPVGAVGLEFGRTERKKPPRRRHLLNLANNLFSHSKSSASGAQVKFAGSFNWAASAAPLLNGQRFITSTSMLPNDEATDAI